MIRFSSGQKAVEGCKLLLLLVYCFTVGLFVIALSPCPATVCGHNCDQVLFSTNLKEWNELIYHYTVDRPDDPSRNPMLGQQTLLVWGQDDPMAPLRFGEQLQRYATRLPLEHGLWQPR